MCLLGIVFQTIPECPVFLLANREESPQRPTIGPEIVAEPSGDVYWLGGRDLEAGGTWLGVNQHGLIVAVTNRKKRDLPGIPRSRGLLCRDLLANSNVKSAVSHAERELGTGKYAGCNFLLASQFAVTAIEAGDVTRVTMLPPGMHLIANDRVNDPTDPRIQRVRQHLQAINSESLGEWIEASKTICGLSGDDPQRAICRLGADWGTVSSSIIALANPFEESRFWYAPGPPADTSYLDYSELLHQLSLS